jgi:peroxisomal 2,4-dienoyl-CoA reductase
MSIFNPGLFQDKVVIVTGGGTGICKGVTQALANLGARTVITSRKAENLEPSSKEIAEKSGSKCLPVVADVRVPQQVEALMAKTLETFGKIDVLINGAAGNFLCPAAGMSYNAFGTVIDIDTKGTWHCSKAAYTAWMGEHGGQILNISATLHYGATPLQLHVSAAKAAIDAMTRNLAVEWGPQGIRVNGIAPGAIADTEGARRLLPGEMLEKLRQATPTRRVGKLADIANLAIFLISDAASNINGQTIVCDGGQCLLGTLFKPDDIAAALGG